MAGPTKHDLEKRVEQLEAKQAEIERIIDVKSPIRDTTYYLDMYWKILAVLDRPCRK